MSLAINVDNVDAVLLADGWHDVADNEDGVSSFSMDAYEYVWGEFVHQDSRHCATLGFDFVEVKTGYRIAGPVTSILAVRRHY